MLRRNKLLISVDRWPSSPNTGLRRGLGFSTIPRSPLAKTTFPIRNRTTPDVYGLAFSADRQFRNTF